MVQTAVADRGTRYAGENAGQLNLTASLYGRTEVFSRDRNVKEPQSNMPPDR